MEMMDVATIKCQVDNMLIFMSRLMSSWFQTNNGKKQTLPIENDGTDWNRFESKAMAPGQRQQLFHYDYYLLDSVMKIKRKVFNIPVDRKKDGCELDFGIDSIEKKTESIYRLRFVILDSRQSFDLDDKYYYYYYYISCFFTILFNCKTEMLFSRF